MRGVVQVSPRVLLLLRQLLDASLQRRAVESDSGGCHQRLFTAAPFLNRTGGIAECVADARKAGKAFVPEIGCLPSDRRKGLAETVGGIGGEQDPGVGVMTKAPAAGKQAEPGAQCPPRACR
jgi:hypothetical protein